MATQKVCDRCGNVTQTIYDVTIVHEYMRIDRIKYELCLDCEKKLKKWLKVGETQSEPKIC